jgi:hypothetical protein
MRDDRTSLRVARMPGSSARIHIDLKKESLNVGRDGRNATLLSELAGIAVQAEEPT